MDSEIAAIFVREDDCWHLMHMPVEQCEGEHEIGYRVYTGGRVYQVCFNIRAAWEIEKRKEGRDIYCKVCRLDSIYCYCGLKGVWEDAERERVPGGDGVCPRAGDPEGVPETGEDVSPRQERRDILSQDEISDCFGGA